jgi:hypothetical protein
LFVSKDSERDRYQAFTGFSDAGYELGLGAHELTNGRSLCLTLLFVGCEPRNALGHQLAASIDLQKGRCLTDIQVDCLTLQSIIEKCNVCITRYFVSWYGIILVV